MNVLPTKMRTAFACLLTSFLLAACATQSSTELQDAEASPDTPSLNSQYMYQTERNAQARMATIVWVHPPKSADLKKSADDDN